MYGFSTSAGREDCPSINTAFENNMQHGKYNRAMQLDAQHWGGRRAQGVREGGLALTLADTSD